MSLVTLYHNDDKTQNRHSLSDQTENYVKVAEGDWGMHNKPSRISVS